MSKFPAKDLCSRRLFDQDQPGTTTESEKELLRGQEDSKRLSEPLLDTTSRPRWHIQFDRGFDAALDGSKAGESRPSKLWIHDFNSAGQGCSYNGIMSAQDAMVFLHRKVCISWVVCSAY